MASCANWEYGSTTSEYCITSIVGGKPHYLTVPLQIKLVYIRQGLQYFSKIHIIYIAIQPESASFEATSCDFLTVFFQ